MLRGKVIITRSLAQELKVPVKPIIKIRAGNIVVDTRLIINNDETRKLYILSPELSRALFIKTKKKLKIRYDTEKNMLHIGPIIGILTASIPNKPEFGPKSTQAELIYLSKIGQKMQAQIFIFTPTGINWAAKTVKGYNYKENSGGSGVWTASTYPLPDVIYDRISSRKSESNYNNTREKLKKLAFSSYFNPSFLNKWDVHQILFNNPELRPYLPETKLLDKENLEDMLKKYKVIYAKPVDGSLGRKIIRITVDEKKQTLKYTVYVRGKFNGQATDATDFIKKTEKNREGKTYIIQQGIDMANYKGSVFDLRIIYQKDRHGEWRISKKFVRLAPKGSSLSNMSRGGKAETSKKILKYFFHRTELIEAKNQEISALCHAVAITMEQSGTGIYGELGLDIGIDKKGKIWLIEVNSKPRKTTETELSMTIVKNTFKRPLEYATYLAGF
ncbi:YheC/YheD family protein [Thermosyntropha sp.]|uniref:YheC/YheD family endospore coat-associated protein n=1 Tax=Thermosyntropha sp. TaxID=2740820 RepID=UPI0025EC4DD1|nr:YheC/YheD family protein [Thermosyntropha sp.]MBO8158426.1 YheC/YheD family protein [Thermosyntropha sp.]